MHIVKSKAKCPKCKNKTNLTLIEIWKNHTISWIVENGSFNLNDGALEHGDPYKVEAKCTCGYQWTIKNVTQIHQLIADEEKI